MTAIAEQAQKETDYITDKPCNLLQNLLMK
jgi:hypothetical protein